MSKFLNKSEILQKSLGAELMIHNLPEIAWPIDSADSTTRLQVATLRQGGRGMPLVMKFVSYLCAV